MAEDCRKSIPDERLMVRGVRQSEINRATGKVKKHAFLPRTNGKDDDGLSVSQPSSDSREQLRARLANAEGLFCALMAGDIRRINEDSVFLDVCPKPTELDPLHSLILGVPTNREQRALATRLAQNLANISAVYDPPEA
jgi:hypothetical protein